MAQNDPGRNWDEEALAQDEKQIEDEIAKAQAMVGEKQSLAALEAEYNEEESGEFLRKAKELRQRYPEWRRVRGNCFYRAVAYAQCERLLCGDGPNRKVDFERFCELAGSWKERLANLNYPKMTTEDGCDVFLDILKRLQDEPSEAKVLEVFNTEGDSENIVVFMRLVAAGYLLRNGGEYGAFVDGNRTIKEFVEQEVNPMHKECDNLCINALSKALNIPIRIEYMDRSQAPEGGWHYDFTTSDNKEPAIYLLYRPGHYDILYPRNVDASTAPKRRPDPEDEESFEKRMKLEEAAVGETALVEEESEIDSLKRQLAAAKKEKEDMKKENEALKNEKEAMKNENEQLKERLAVQEADAESSPSAASTASANVSPLESPGAANEKNGKSDDTSSSGT